MQRWPRDIDLRKGLLSGTLSDVSAIVVARDADLEDTSLHAWCCQTIYPNSNENIEHLLSMLIKCLTNILLLDRRKTASSRERPEDLPYELWAIQTVSGSAAAAATAPHATLRAAYTISSSRSATRKTTYLPPTSNHVALVQPSPPGRPPQRPRGGSAGKV
jgi:hypothetical protein